MAAINPYLNFNGNTEEAFNFYRSIFGGEFSALMRWGDNGGCGEGSPLSETDLSKIMHISLPIGSGSLLMASDALESFGQNAVPGTNSYVAIQADNREEADRLFNGLSDGGKVEMPMSEMFWGGYFGSFTDKFGIRWLINCDLKNAN
jgi:PhnB protein